MKNIFIAGNWKMNKNIEEVESFFTSLIPKIKERDLPENLKLFIAPAFPFILQAKVLTKETPVIIGAQNVSEQPKGAFTGEVSADMLKSMNVEYCIVGHSERRKYYGDEAQNLIKKMRLLQSNKIIPIFCIGESLQQRENDKTEEVILHQLESVLTEFNINSAKELVIAYEPVWAIGTGKTATPEQAQKVHALIRKWLADNYDEQIATEISILYGGSVKPENIANLISQNDIDGGLIGGAALDAQKYVKMIDIVKEEIE